MTRWLVFASMVALGAAAACSNRVDAGGSDVDAGADDDPLDFAYNPPEGSLDDIYRTIIAKRCSGQPGLCHNSQFEPNLSTPANAYAYLVNRPALEKPSLLRVNPGDPASSVLIDKLRGRDVSTVMPLGAEPLSEDEIKKIEDWIRDGALRRPSADPAPTLNNPPKVPEIGVFTSGGTRLDVAGSYTVAPGTSLVIRHTVHDFETADTAIPFSTVILSAPDGRNVVLRPGAMSDPHLGYTTYDAAGPEGNGDTFNYRFELTLGATVDLRDDATGSIETVPSSGLTLTPIAFYIDEFPSGILSFTIATASIIVE